MYIKIKEPYERTIHIMKVHHETEDFYVCELKMDNSYLCADKKWLLAKSDTIEELCDDFVYSDETFKNVIYSRLEQCNIVKLTAKCYQIYGAVWCEWGLKYVAKMDSEGKLELI